tara:strand:+ start:109 stop:363 length:255 start_codon:yes stop_codon:yes gene_type:complete
MSSFGTNNVAQQIEDDNAKQAFKENETFLQTLYDSNNTTDANFNEFKTALLLKIKTDLDGITNSSTTAQIGTALQALNKSLKEL